MIKGLIAKIKSIFKPATIQEEQPRKADIETIGIVVKHPEPPVKLFEEDVNCHVGRKFLNDLARIQSKERNGRRLMHKKQKSQEKNWDRWKKQ